MNQASRKFWLVPVLPPAGQPASARLRAGAHLDRRLQHVVHQRDALDRGDAAEAGAGRARRARRRPACARAARRRAAPRSRRSRTARRRRSARAASPPTCRARSTGLAPSGELMPMRFAVCTTASGVDLVGELRRDRVDRERQRLLQRHRPADICRRSSSATSCRTSPAGRSAPYRAGSRAARSRSDRRTA